MDFFLESPFMPNRVKLDRETLGGLADMFGQMPGVAFIPRCHDLDSLFILTGILKLCGMFNLPFKMLCIK